MSVRYQHKNFQLFTVFSSLQDSTHPVETFSVLDYSTLIQGADTLSEPEDGYWQDFCNKPENPEQLKSSNKT